MFVYNLSDCGIDSTCIVMLAKSKLYNIETLISKLLIDLEISQEEFKAIVNENEKYEKLKEEIRMMKTSDELNKKEEKILKQ